jgi:hypothetical protein
MAKRSNPSRREAAIEALLTCATIKDAAVKVGFTDRTLRSWLKEPEFLAQYRAARRQVFDAALGRLQGAASTLKSGQAGMLALALAGRLGRLP